MEQEEIAASVDRIGRRAWPGGRAALDRILEPPARRDLPVGWLAATAVGVLLVGAPLLALYGGSMSGHVHGRPVTVAVAGSPSPSASAVAPAPTASTASSPAIPTLTTPVPGGVPTAPPVPTPGSTARPTPVASATPAGGECTGRELSVQATTDQASYTVGQSVTITLTVTNVSARTCWVPVGGCATDMFEVFDASGNMVWAAFENSSQACTSTAAQQTTLSPGASLSRTSAWAQQECGNPNSGCSTPSLAPRGAYQAGGFWQSSDGSVPAARRQFSLR